MTAFIHPTAFVEPGAQLGHDVYIGPFCYVTRHATIGDRTRLEAYVSVGTSPEHKGYWSQEHGSAVIGADCVVREFVTINAGTVGPTLVGNHVCLLRGSHVGHDAVVEDEVTVSCNVMIGGHALVARGANLGLGVLIHQRCEIPPYSMLGMGTVVTMSSQLEAFGTYVGAPARWLKQNDHAIKHRGFSAEQVEHIRSEFNARKAAHLKAA